LVAALLLLKDDGHVQGSIGCDCCARRQRCAFRWLVANNIVSGQ
jgi:hypothetical protein